MTPEEREDLRREFEQLTKLLKFHVDYDGKLSMSPSEHTEYRDKILDLMVLIQRRLKESGE